MEKMLSGKPVSNLINQAVRSLISEYQLCPKMLLIQVGEDPASSYYVQSIISSGQKLGCKCDLLTLPDNTSQHELIQYIISANAESTIHGIMIQKPLPGHIDESAINYTINPSKDLDCLHPLNLGKIMMQSDGFLPGTPAAVFYCMFYYGIDPSGKNLVILGRSNVVGKPLANMLLWKKDYANATVTVCHSRTVGLANITSSADILIAAIGKPNFVTADMIKENCILLDVGINEVRNENSNSVFVGDIDYNSCFSKALAITPVPGGIGRITTSTLYLNLIKAALEANGINKTIDEYLALILSEIR